MAARMWKAAVLRAVTTETPPGRVRVDFPRQAHVKVRMVGRDAGRLAQLAGRLRMTLWIAVPLFIRATIIISNGAQKVPVW